jgi:hypothetical protein
MTRDDDDDAGVAGIVGVLPCPAGTPPAYGGGGTIHLWGKWRP